MSRQFYAYLENSYRVRALVSLHDYVRGALTSAIDTSDILRAAHVLSVSALDSYIHEIVRAALMDIYDGRRAGVRGYSRFRVNLGNFVGHDDICSARTNIEGDIREQHGYLAFQHPDKIADAIRCISDVKLWDEVATRLNLPAKAVKERLILIVERRNKIAHEADIDPTYGTLWPVHSNDMMGVIDFIDSIVSEIDEIIAL